MKIIYKKMLAFLFLLMLSLAMTLYVHTVLLAKASEVILRVSQSAGWSPRLAVNLCDVAGYVIAVLMAFLISPIFASFLEIKHDFLLALILFLLYSLIMGLILHQYQIMDSQIRVWLRAFLRMLTIPLTFGLCFLGSRLLLKRIRGKHVAG